tara:strand:+ start:1612 stop:2001 length:390 start_codon:yes stop_codon:yes gene_type:complete
MDEEYHIYLEHFSKTPNEWVRFYRTPDGLIEEKGTCAGRHARFTPKYRKTHHDKGNDYALREIQDLKHRGFDIMPDPYTGEIKRRILDKRLQLKEKEEYEKMLAKEAAERLEKIKKRRHLGGRRRFEGL